MDEVKRDPTKYFKGKAGPGRPKGCPNKSPIKKVQEILLETNRHPVTELFLLLDSLEPKDRATVWLQLLKYCEAYAVPVNQSQDEKPIEITYTRADDGN